MNQMDTHPAAEIFPLLQGPEFDELVEDIRANGLREPIICTEDWQILDGRNRYRACQIAEVPAEFKAFEGSDPWAYVVSMNLHRRHLTDTQRAMVAGKIATRANGKYSKTASSIEEAVLPPTHEEARRLLQVSQGSLDRAKKIQKNGTPQLAQAVTDGHLSLSKGAQIATEHEETQQDTAVDRHINTAASPRSTNTAATAKPDSSLTSEKIEEIKQAEAKPLRQKPSHRGFDPDAETLSRENVDRLATRNKDQSAAMLHITRIAPETTYGEATRWAEDLAVGIKGLRRMRNIILAHRNSLFN